MDKLVDQQKLQHQLDRAIRILPGHEQAAFTLFYVSNLTQKEIARFLELPQTTINNHLHGARRRLKAELIQMASDNLHEQRPSRDSAFSERVGEHIEALTSFHDRLVLPLTTLFSEVLDKDVVVSITSVNHTIAVEVLQNSSNPCCIYTFVPADGQKRIFIDFDMTIVATLVGRKPSLDEAMRAADLALVTEQEVGILHPIAKRVLMDLVGIWTNLLNMEIKSPELDTSPVNLVANPKMKTVDPEEPIFHVHIAVTWKNHTSAIHLCYPATSLAAAIEHLKTA